jgi:hypothetical protein
MIEIKKWVLNNKLLLAGIFIGAAAGYLSGSK